MIILLIQPITLRVFLSCPKNPTILMMKKKIIYLLSFFLLKIPLVSLFKVMGGFATNNVNMIKLESYNYGEQFTITEFYCEIEGHPSQHNTKLALDDLNHYCSKVKNLGVFEKSSYRSRQ